MKQQLRTLKLAFLSMIALSCSKDDTIQQSEVVNISVQDLVVTIDENPKTGQVLGTIKATTTSGKLSYKLAKESKEGAFEVNETSGEVTVKKATLFDFETNKQLTATVTVTNGDQSKDSNVEITLKDVETEVTGKTIITATDLEVTIAENPDNGFLIGKISASTEKSSLSFALESASVANAITVSAETGEVVVADVTAFDYETNTNITAVVIVTAEDQSTVKVAINITITDVQEGFPFDENSNGLIDIYTIEQLAAIRLDADGNGVADNTSSATDYATAFPNATSGTYTGYELMNNLDFSDTSTDFDNEDLKTFYKNNGWTPIPSYNAKFEGNNYSIKNLKISKSTSGNVGFFAVLDEKAYVNKVGFDNINVEGRNNVGGIAGQLKGQIQRCYVKGSIYATGGLSSDNAYKFNTRVGGMVGIMSSGSSSSTITSINFSYVDANVSAPEGYQVGGLIGATSVCSNGSICTMSVGDCYVKGSVSGKNITGGFIGEMLSNISVGRCYSIASVTGSGGFFFGSSGGTTANENYYDKTLNGGNTDTRPGATGKTSTEMKTPTTLDTGIYINWGRSTWDFGTANQYPAIIDVAGGVAGQR